jgi:4-carboxymuconolactone decarboxylase
MNRKSILIWLLLAAATSALAQERLPRIPPEQYTSEQKQAAAEFEAARKAPVFGPFEPLLHSPELMSRSRAMGDYLRYASAIGNSLSELVILMTAREWNQDYEWSVHYPIALKAGISQDVANAVANGQRPKSMTVDETIVFDYTAELLKSKRVSDATFARAQSKFGDKGVVDMTGIAGYYTLLAMQLNVAQYRPPVDAAKLPSLAH